MQGQIKPLDGELAGRYRLRIGDWRVIFAVEDDAVMIGGILPRGGGCLQIGGLDMSEKAVKLHSVIDILNDDQLDALYNVACLFVAERDFDDFTDEQTEALAHSFDELKKGNGVSFRFDSETEALAHFGIAPQEAPGNSRLSI
jgi:hypothetical protein